MSSLQLFELGYKLATLPINTSECATGDLRIFESRLEMIKSLLTELNLQKYQTSLNPFERLLKEEDFATFLRENYDQLNQTIAGLEMLILLELGSQKDQNIFKLGVGIAHIQLSVVGAEYNEEVEELYSQVQSIMNELIEDNNLSEQAKAYLEQFSKVDYLLFQDEHEVLKLKDIIYDTLREE